MKTSRSIHFNPDYVESGLDTTTTTKTTRKLKSCPRSILHVSFAHHPCQYSVGSNFKPNTVPCPVPRAEAKISEEIATEIGGFDVKV